MSCLNMHSCIDNGKARRNHARVWYITSTRSGSAYSIHARHALLVSPICSNITGVHELDSIGVYGLAR